MRNFIRNVLRRCGYDIVSYCPLFHPVARRISLMSQNGIDMLLDVGANTGQYAQRARSEGYRGEIISFEPLSSAFNTLSGVAQSDASWIAVNIALGDKDGSEIIHVSRNSQSSSLLDMLPDHVDASPDSAYVASEEIRVKKLDTVFEEYCQPGKNVFLKIDAQGYEKNIIDGAVASLDRISCVQMELSLVPLYEGETLMAEMINDMRNKGFTLMSIDPTYGNRETGQVLQVDCIFVRQNTG